MNHTFQLSNCGFGFGNKNTINQTNDLNLIHPEKNNIYHDNDDKQDKGEENLPQKIEGLLGVAKSDVFLSTSILLSYTVEVNYKTYNYKNENKSTEKHKFREKDYQKIGKDLLLSLQEFCKIRKKSIFEKTKYKNLENFIQFLKEKSKGN